MDRCGVVGKRGRVADAVRLVHQRGAFMQEAVPPDSGKMAALLGIAAAEVEALCQDCAGDGILQPANYNDPGQIVIAGEAGRVQAAVAAAQARRLGKTVLLNVSAPFHCQMLQPAAERLQGAMAGVAFGDFAFPVIANVTAMPYPHAHAVEEMLVRQVCAPVRWEASMRYAVAEGCEVLVEVGPGQVLGGMMRRIARHVQNMTFQEALQSAK